MILQILILIAIITVVAAVAFLGNGIARNIKRNSSCINKLKQNLRNLEEKVNDLDRNVANLQSELQARDRNISELSAHINSLQSKISQGLSQNATAAINANPSSKPTVQKQTKTPEVTEVVKYVQQLDDNGFSNEYLRDQITKFTKFVVRIKGDKATFEVPEDSTCQEKILNGYSSIVSFIDEIATCPSPTSIRNNQPGTLVRKGDEWIVEKKLKVSLS